MCNTKKTYECKIFHFNKVYEFRLTLYKKRLTLSGAHFSGASTPNMIVTIRVFGVADNESEIRYSNLKMADPIWRSKFSERVN